MTRREVLQGTAGVAGIGLAGAPRPVWGASSSDVVRAENEKQGTTDWMLTRGGLDKSGFRCPWVEGYCNRTSVRAGEKLEIKISTDPPASFALDIFRMGYYQGHGGRLMKHLGPFEGRAQPVPGPGDGHVRECTWETSVTLEIPHDWVSGVYLGKLTERKTGFQSYIVFVVRDDRPCQLLYQVSDMTWQAYNTWPVMNSLYQNPRKPNVWWGPETRVSFDRPYGAFQMHPPIGYAGGQFLAYEFHLVHWLEKEGYDVSYISGVDVHSDAEGLLRARCWLDGGHDEYWSLDAFHNLEKAVSAGVGAGFLAGNVMYGVLKVDPSGAGVPNRIIERTGVYGGADPRHKELGYPEALEFKMVGPMASNLVGGRSIYPFTGYADWICRNHKHWLYDGTGMKNGDRIPNLIGWEWQGDPPHIKGLDIVAQGAIRSTRPGTCDYAATVYKGPKGNPVFNASTIWWPLALISPPGFRPCLQEGVTAPGPDARVQRMTANFLSHFRKA